MADTDERRSFMEKLSEKAAMLGNQIHLKTMRDAFASLSPLYITAGFAVLVDRIILRNFLSIAVLETAEYVVSLVISAIANFSGLLLALCVGFFLSRNRRFDNPLAAAVISFTCFIVMTLSTIGTAPVFGSIEGILEGFSDSLGVKGMLAGIITGLIATELFIKISNSERLKIKSVNSVPGAVVNSFNALIPIILTLALFSIISSIAVAVFHVAPSTLIYTMLQAPLKHIGTSLVGCIVIYSIGNLLFTQGIHQTVVYGSFLEPLLIINMVENMSDCMASFAPNIINVSMVTSFGMLGGSGSTICLVLATLLFSKYNTCRDTARMALAPGMFNINEPVIFGYPIVFNRLFIIPFIMVPILGIVVTYFATEAGIMNQCIVQIPWTIPPLLSGFLATAGDWRAVLIQLGIIIIDTLIYLPFMRTNEKAQMDTTGEEH